MKLNFLKKILVVLFLVQSVFVFSQDSNALAKAYLTKAQESFKAQDKVSTEKYLKKSIQHFGANASKELTLFATKYYVLHKKYQKAKEFAELYFKVEKNKDSKEYNEMLLTFIDIEDNIDSGVVEEETITTVKEVKKDIPVVEKPAVSKPNRTLSKSKKGEVGKTLRAAYLLSKKYVSSKKYAFAKQNLDKFFALKPKKDTRFYNEMVEVKKKVDQVLSTNNSNMVGNTSKTPSLTSPEKNEIKEKSEEKKITSDVSFAIIEEVPVFPGCSGTRKEKANCLSTSIQRHVLRNFNANLASTLGLTPGKKKIWIVFRIDEAGKVSNISIRAPHPKLKEEALRITKLLPKMEPGKQRGKPVGMKYTLPITFNVEGDSEKETKEN